MERVANSHPDLEVKKFWREKARTFRGGNMEERESVLDEIGRGILVLLSTPFVLVGGALRGVGSLLGGVASVLTGIGGLAGKLRPSKRKPSGI
ncbi:hypothetical protein AN958_03519 [Leucoagaricus sp. SymC.cos]|nr:hypothetical protein AN958_03519 [Leucoagaricus sp. SymC.cos]